MKMRRWGWRYSELYCEVHPTSAKIPTEDVASWCLGLINISCFAPEKSLWYSEADLQRRIRRLSGCSAHRCSGFLLLQVGSHRHRETLQQKKKIMIFYDEMFLSNWWIKDWTCEIFFHPSPLSQYSSQEAALHAQLHPPPPVRDLHPQESGCVHQRFSAVCRPKHGSLHRVHGEAAAQCGHDCYTFINILQLQLMNVFFVSWSLHFLLLDKLQIFPETTLMSPEDLFCLGKVPKSYLS